MLQACEDHGCGFLLRAQHNRNVNGNTSKLWELLGEKPVLGCRKVKLPARAGRPARTAKLDIRATQVTLDRPKHDSRFNEPKTVWAVYATEVLRPQRTKEVEPIEWMLLTSEPTETFKQADRCVDWYTHRLVIEEFHKVEKTGCRLEASQLDDAEDIKRLAAMTAVTAVRLLMLREIVHRAADPQKPEQNDPAVLQRSVPWLWIEVVAKANRKDPREPEQLTPREFWLRIARQGGHIARRRDGKPGWSTIWKGWYDFMYMFKGAELMANQSPRKSCG